MDIDIDIHSLSPQEFAAYTLVDIREPQEYGQWPATTEKVEYLPFSEFPANKGYFKKGRPYLLFCAAGGRSHHMAEFLATEGIEASSVNYGIGAVNDYLSRVPKNA